MQSCRNRLELLEKVKKRYFLLSCYLVIPSPLLEKRSHAINRWIIWKRTNFVLPFPFDSPRFAFQHFLRLQATFTVTRSIIIGSVITFFPTLEERDKEFAGR